MALFSEFFKSVPWFLPGLAVWLLVALAATPRVSRRLEAERLLVFPLLMALGIVILATLTPTSVALAGLGSGSAACDLGRLGLPPRSEVLAVHDTLRNILLFVPLGLAVGLLPRRPTTAVVVVAAYSLPLVIETIQLIAPAMGRGCQSADVIDNSIGLTLGLVIGSVAAGAARRWSARRHDDEAGGTVASRS